MRLAIKDTVVDITSCTRMRDTKRGFYLDITIPKSNIGMEELYNLLEDCTETIIITDNDGNVNEYNGFKTLSNFSCENGVYKIAQVCTSEYEAQLSLAQSTIKALEDKIASDAEKINAQSATIVALNDELLNTQLALCELYENKNATDDNIDYEYYEDEHYPEESEVE